MPGMIAGMVVFPSQVNGVVLKGRRAAGSVKRGPRGLQKGNH